MLAHSSADAPSRGRPAADPVLGRLFDREALCERTGRRSADEYCARGFGEPGGALRQCRHVDILFTHHSGAQSRRHPLRDGRQPPQREGLVVGQVIERPAGGVCVAGEHRVDIEVTVGGFGSPAERFGRCPGGGEPSASYETFGASDPYSKLVAAVFDDLPAGHRFATRESGALGLRPGGRYTLLPPGRTDRIRKIRGPEVPRSRDQRPPRAGRCALPTAYHHPRFST